MLHFCCMNLLKYRFKVLRDGQLQGGGDRGVEAEGGHADGGGHHLQVQEGEPDHVRLGDPGQAAHRGSLHPGERPQRLQHQQVQLDLF